MSSNNFNTMEPWLFVDINYPNANQINLYYENTGEMKVSDSSTDAPRVFKKVKILHTFNEEKYPVGSEWMMGEVPGMKINFFGVKYTVIQEKDLYARLD